MTLRITLPADGAVVPYVDDGAGPTVVLVHGALTDLRMWDAHRVLLRERHRTIACTLRYFGTEPWQEHWPPFGVVTRHTRHRRIVSPLSSGATGRPPSAPGNSAPFQEALVRVLANVDMRRCRREVRGR